MNSENDLAWSQLEENALETLRPNTAARALVTAGRTRRRKKMEPILAGGLAVVLGLGICTSSWVKADQQQTANLILWQHTVAANMEVIRSL